MNMRRQVVLLTFALFAVALGTATVQAQVDQSALARQILGGNSRERSRALEAAGALGPQIGLELRAALIKSLERANEVQAQRYHADLRGEPLEPLLEDPEFTARVSRVVAELRDPWAIPALVGALGTGSPVTRALVAFGEEAVPALLGAVRSPESTHYVVEEALVAFRFLVEGAGPHPLSAGTLNEIRRATKQRLTGKQYFTTLWDAIDLAIALKDPDLRRIVKSLASDRDAVVARGIEDPETIEETQRLAAERLAGVPPQRRWT
ncbi:MAG: hypothetical protein ACREMW_02970 [Gemmatimonadales bacterium]